MDTDKYHTDKKQREIRSMYAKELFQAADDLHSILFDVKLNTVFEQRYFKKMYRKNLDKVNQEDILTYTKNYEIINCAYEDLLKHKKHSLFYKLLDYINI